MPSGLRYSFIFLIFSVLLYDTLSGPWFYVILILGLFLYAILCWSYTVSDSLLENTEKIVYHLKTEDDKRREKEKIRDEANDDSGCHY